MSFWLGCCEWHLSPLGYWRGEALLGPGSRWRGSTWWSLLPLLAAFHTFKVHWVLDSSAASQRPQPRGTNAALVFWRIKHVLKNPVWLCRTAEFHLYTRFSAGGVARRPNLMVGLNPGGRVFLHSFKWSLDTPMKSPEFREETSSVYARSKASF